MHLFTFIAILIAIAAALTWLNDRINKLPTSIGVMLGGLLLAAIVLSPPNPSPENEWAKSLLETFNLSDLLLSIPIADATPGSGSLLGLLLFATALRVEPSIFMRFRLTLITWLSTAGVIITAFGVAFLLWLLIWMFEQERPYFIYMLLFGAILAPTDPVAVMDMFKKAKVATPVRDVIAGEALVNDASSIIMFLVVLALIPNNVRFDAMNSSSLDWMKMFALEIGGGMFTGAVIGTIATILIRTSRKNESVVLITIAAAVATICVAPLFLGSVPLATVTCGMIIGRSALLRREQLSLHTNHLWWVVETVLTTIIFLLVGLELIGLNFALYKSALYGLLTVPILLIVRMVVVALPWMFTRMFKKNAMSGRDVIIMSWCGLRGTVSLAMAVCIPAGVVGIGRIEGEPVGEQMLIATFVVVLVTLTLQGLTLPALVRFLYRKERLEEEALEAAAAYGPQSSLENPRLPL
jgi:CPA1 family monovalent cation:H+ antiporter